MIKIRNLSKEFGRQTAVRNIDLDIPAGQLVGLLGPNGAGKSTTIKMLTGMLMPTSGTAEVAAHVIVNPKPGGVWVGLWGEEDSPDFISAGRMIVFDPPRRIVFSDFEYLARSGPLPFAANLTSEFTVNPIGPGRTSLRVVQDGFPMDSAADDSMQAVRLVGAIPSQAFDVTGLNYEPDLFFSASHGRRTRWPLR